MIDFSKTGYRGRRRARAACIAALVALGGWSAIASSATFLIGTGGVTSRFKGIATNTDLICDLSGVAIEATLAPLSFSLGGAEGATVRCTEVPTGTSAGGTSGLFTLKQTALELCLKADTSVPGETTYYCRILTPEDCEDEEGNDLPEVCDGADPATLSKARWTVEPKPEFVDTFCADPANPGVNYSPCYAELGTPFPGRVVDFPNRNVDGDPENDFPGDGYVFSFTLPSGKFQFAPCHSGTFEGGSPVACEFEVDDPNNPGQKITLSTRSVAAIDSDFSVQTHIRLDSLNLKNTSSSASFEVVFYGSQTLDVGRITRTNGQGASAFGILDPSGVRQTLAVKGTRVGHEPGPAGEPADAYPDLVVQFLRGSLTTPGTFIYALTHPNGSTRTVCPLDPLTVSARFSGILDGNPSIGWLGEDDLAIFNCGRKPPRCDRDDDRDEDEDEDEDGHHGKHGKGKGKGKGKGRDKDKDRDDDDGKGRKGKGR